jgi:hypothetical protein
VLGGAVRPGSGGTRSGWLSAFGGIAVAYVFVHLLPELAEGQATLEEGSTSLGSIEDHVYLVALLGLAVFYGIEQHTMRSRRAAAAADGERCSDSTAFWLSMMSYAVYNVVIGYLLLRGELKEAREVLLYAVALGVHFVVNDFALREHHRARYDHIGRWVLSAAVLAGCAIGLLGEISEPAVALTLAFLGGGVVLNVMKEELPGEREARFVPFVLGALAYAVVLQLS